MAEPDIDELPDGSAAEDFDTKAAAPWLNLIEQAEAAFQTYNDRCDKVDRLYANLERLGKQDRDREMSLFWANMQVLTPAIYARPPTPVVVPRFRDRRPVPRVSAELLERSTIVAFETGHIDRSLKLVRNDLARLARGVLWTRFEAGKATPSKAAKRVCVDYKFRRDFIHDPARTWAEVDWVDGVSYMTKSEMRKRFRRISGDAYQKAAYEVRKTGNGEEKHDQRRKARVHEIWCRSENKVIWVADGCEKLLEEAPPHLELEDFFPCPEPAYGTTQPGTLVPVPDVLQYKDQLDEINQLTNRIHALADALKVRGFYPGGAGEIGDAIEAAIKAADDNQVMVPISNWAALGDGNANDVIIWLPIDQIASTIVQLVSLRRQLIQDVYEISGISDILRGQSDPNETLGAQELKAQTGSVRVKGMQEEVVRLSRDVTRIACEIMAEDFDGKTLLEMSQMELPTDADVKASIAKLEARGARLQKAVQEVMQSPETAAMAQANPQEAQQAQQFAEQKAQQILGQIEELKKAVTIDQVMDFLRDQRLRPFTLDIETDSTIAPDENAQKQRATEYVTSMTGLLRELVPAVQNVPQLAPIASEMISYVNGVFRVGRSFEQVVNEFAEQMKQMAAQPKGPSPEAMAAQATAETAKADAQAKVMTAQAEQKRAETDAQTRQIENAERAQALTSKEREEQQKALDAEQQRAFKAQAHDQDMEAKRTLAGIQQQAAQEARANAAQQHQQAMDKGALEITLLQGKIEQQAIKPAPQSNKEAV